MFNVLCCNFKPCDAADENEPETQEKEDSAQELLDWNNGMYYSNRRLIKCE